MASSAKGCSSHDFLFQTITFALESVEDLDSLPCSHIRSSYSREPAKVVKLVSYWSLGTACLTTFSRLHQLLDSGAASASARSSQSRCPTA